MFFVLVVCQQFEVGQSSVFSPEVCLNLMFVKKKFLFSRSVSKGKVGQKMGSFFSINVPKFKLGQKMFCFFLQKCAKC